MSWRCLMALIKLISIFHTGLVHNYIVLPWSNYYSSVSSSARPSATSRDTRSISCRTWRSRRRRLFIGFLGGGRWLGGWVWAGLFFTSSFRWALLCRFISCSFAFFRLLRCASCSYFGRRSPSRRFSRFFIIEGWSFCRRFLRNLLFVVRFCLNRCPSIFLD